MELYFLQSGTGLLISYLVYYLFFRKDLLFMRNRFYLLASMILSFLIPVLNFPGIPSLVRISRIPHAQAGLPVPIAVTGENGTASAGGNEAGFLYSPAEVLLIIYLAGVLFMLAHFIWQIFYVYLLSRRSEKV